MDRFTKVINLGVMWFAILFAAARVVGSFILPFLPTLPKHWQNWMAAVGYLPAMCISRGPLFDPLVFMVVAGVFAFGAIYCMSPPNWLKGARSDKDDCIYVLLAYVAFSSMLLALACIEARYSAWEYWER